MANVLIDPSFDRLQTALGKCSRLTAWNRASERLAELEAQVNVVRGSPLIYDEAQEPLRSLHDLLAAEIVTRAHSFSALRWLWYSRRTPNQIFAGQLATTGFLVRYLLETAADIGASRDESFDPDPDTGGLSFPVDEASLDHFLLQVELARRLHALQASLRLVGKGASVTFLGSGVPEVRTEPTLRAAVDLYDQRCLSEGPHFTRLGTVLSSGVYGHHDTLRVGVMWRLDTARLVSVAHDPFTGAPIQLSAHYEIGSMYFGGVLAFLSESDDAKRHVWTPLVAALFVLLRAADHAFARKALPINPSLMSGYTLVVCDTLHSFLAEVLSEISGVLAQHGWHYDLPASAADVVVELDKPGQLFPSRHGPLLVRTHLGYLLNFPAATQALASLLEYPADTGDVANTRSLAFEHAIQSGLDASPWAPPPAWRHLVGKSLYLDRTALTDIDAVGYRNGKILLVSCKSVRYSADYDAGDWRAVRSARTRVVDAVSEQATLVSKLESRWADISPPLPAKEQLVAIVCVPHVIFVPLGDATDDAAPGLRKAVSASELLEWLHRNT
jgi:hypothetical protein